MNGSLWYALVSIFFLAMFFCQAFAALQRDWFTVTGMQEGNDVDRGIPLLYHGSMWGNIYLWYVMATICDNYAAGWSYGQIEVALLIGIVGSMALTLLWRKTAKNEAHQETWAWIPLALQLAGAIAISFAFFTFSSNIPKPFALKVALALFFYVFLSMHLVLRAFRPTWFAGKPERDPMTWVTLIAVGAALIVGYQHIT